MSAANTDLVGRAVSPFTAAAGNLWVGGTDLNIAGLPDLPDVGVVALGYVAGGGSTAKAVIELAFHGSEVVAKFPKSDISMALRSDCADLVTGHIAAILRLIDKSRALAFTDLLLNKEAQGNG